MSGNSSRNPPLWDRYTRSQGRVHLTGLQALIRLPLEQIRRDRREGRRTAALFSGYPGSPLAGLDLTLQRLRELLEREEVRLVPGLNEELAASAIVATARPPRIARLFTRLLPGRSVASTTNLPHERNATFGRNIDHRTRR